MPSSALKLLGAAIGVIAALVLVETRSTPPAQNPASDIVLSEYGGALREIVIHYVAGDSIAAPVYASFLPQLDSGVVVDVVCPDRASFDELAGRIGRIACSMRPIIVGHEMTVWSRDRWVALQPKKETAPVTLLTPADEDGSAAWPQRAGDAKVASDLQRLLPGSITARMLPLFFDAGDLLADESNVFVAPMVLQKNVSRTISGPDELSTILGKALARNIVLLDDAPQHHLGMYMMAIDKQTMLIGDPSLGRPLRTVSFPPLPQGPDFSDAMQQRFDAVATQVRTLGYKVIRIPTLVAPDHKTFLTYVNVITEQRGQQKLVYMPTYRGAEPLNEAATRVWTNLGYTVRPVDCTSSYPYFGNLHCLVNVLRRSR